MRSPQEEGRQHDPHDRLKVREDRGLAGPHHVHRLVPPDVRDRSQQALEEDDRPRGERAEARRREERRREHGGRQDQERAQAVGGRRRQQRGIRREHALAVHRVHGPATERGERDEVAGVKVGGLQPAELAARDDQEHAEDGGGHAEPLGAPEPLAEIETGDQRDRDWRRRLQDDRVAGCRVVDREIRELHRAPDAGRSEDQKRRDRVGPEPADRVARRAGQQHEQEDRRHGAADRREEERGKVGERELGGGRKAPP
jgi:hypothetical protein